MPDTASSLLHHLKALQDQHLEILAAALWTQKLSLWSAPTTKFCFSFCFCVNLCLFLCRSFTPQLVTHISPQPLTQLLVKLSGGFRREEKGCRIYHCGKRIILSWRHLGMSRCRRKPFFFLKSFYLPKSRASQRNSSVINPLPWEFRPHLNGHCHEAIISSTYSPKAPLSFLKVICFPVSALCPQPFSLLSPRFFLLAARFSLNSRGGMWVKVCLFPC